MSESTTQHYLTALYQSPYIKAMNLIQESFANGDKLKTWELLESFFYGLPPDAYLELEEMYAEIKTKLSIAEKSRQNPDYLIKDANRYEATGRILRTKNLEFYHAIVHILFKLKYLEKGAIVGENPNPDHIGLATVGKNPLI